MNDRNLYNSTRKAWEDIWDAASVDVELQTSYYRRSIRGRNHYLPYLNQEDVILEAGSGLSSALIPLREMGYKVVGVDYALNSLHASRDHTPELALAGADIHHLPFADNSVGAYLSFGVLEHFEHGMHDALVEAHRILKPDGIAVITIPYPNIVWKLAQWRRNQQGRQLIDDSFYESTYTKDQLVSELTQANFDVVASIPTSHSFTLWGLGGIFQGKGYYETSDTAEFLGGIFSHIMPWTFNFMTMMIAQKPSA
ncbi:MAG: class I SAM-dependent methyltransferase [Chloroflexota bacterium]